MSDLGGDAGTQKHPTVQNCLEVVQTAVASNSFERATSFLIRPLDSPNQNLCLVCHLTSGVCYFNKGWLCFISWRVSRKHKSGQLSGHVLKRHLSNLTPLNRVHLNNVHLQEAMARLTVAYGGGFAGLSIALTKKAGCVQSNFLHTLCQERGRYCSPKGLAGLFIHQQLL